MAASVNLRAHREPAGIGDRIARGLVKILRFIADTFFAKRYGHRAVVPAPSIAIRYWTLPADARLRDVNHGFADELAKS